MDQAQKIELQEKSNRLKQRRNALTTRMHWVATA